MSCRIYNNAFGEKYAEDLISKGAIDLFNTQAKSRPEIYHFRLLRDEDLEAFHKVFSHRSLNQFELFKKNICAKSDILKGLKFNQFSSKTAAYWQIMKRCKYTQAETEAHELVRSLDFLQRKFKFLNCAFFCVLGREYNSNECHRPPDPQYFVNVNGLDFYTAFNKKFGNAHYFYMLNKCKIRKVCKPKNVVLEGYTEMKKRRLISEVRKALNVICTRK